MSRRPFSASSLVATWLLVLTQHKPLVDVLAETNGVQLDRHVRNLALHLMAVLEDQTIDQEAVQRARRAHAHVEAFGESRLHLSVFVLDSFALVAHAAGLPQLSTFDAINNLALQHGALVEVGTLASRAARATTTLAAIKGGEEVTGNVGAQLVLDFITSPDGRQALRLDEPSTIVEDCKELLSLTRGLTEQAQARDVIDFLMRCMS